MLAFILVSYVVPVRRISLGLRPSIRNSGERALVQNEPIGAGMKKAA